MEQNCNSMHWPCCVPHVTAYVILGVAMQLRTDQHTLAEKMISSGLTFTTLRQFAGSADVQ